MPRGATDSAKNFPLDVQVLKCRFNDQVDVTQGGRQLRVEGPGEFFGEIGLLREVPRTATVTAVEDARLLTLTREDFLAAVHGTDASMAAAYDIVTARMG